MSSLRTEGTVARCGAFGLLAAVLAGGLLLIGGDAQPGRKTPPSAEEAIAVRMPEAVAEMEPLTRREQAASGDRPLRAPDGPGIQGWLAVEGGEQPRSLAARGAGLPADLRVEVAADGRFAIADAIAGERYLLTLPEEFVTSHAPTDESVVGSRYVHLVAPARVDVLAQTLAGSVRLRLVKPDGAGPASGMRALCTLDGRDARMFPMETDAQGWIVVPLPSDGWWSNLAVDPRLYDDELYEPIYVSRVDVPASGVVGGVRLVRSRVETLLFLDPADRPVADVRAAEPVTCAPSDADGRLRVRAREADAARWTHRELEPSAAFWPDESGGSERIVRMVPRGSWKLVATGMEMGADLRLTRVSRAFEPGSRSSRGGSVLRDSSENGIACWEIENRLIGPGDGLLVAWRGIPVRLEPLGFARAEGETRPVAGTELVRFVVEVLLPDGSPAGGASVFCGSTELGSAGADGVLAFDLPVSLERQSLVFGAGRGSAPIAFEFEAGDLPAVPSTLQFERAEKLLLMVSTTYGEPPRTVEVETAGRAGTITARLRLRDGAASGGNFPPGPRWYRISAEGFGSRSVYHDVGSNEPLRLTLEAASD